MRLTCMSNKLFGSILTPVTRCMYCAKHFLLAILAEAHSAWSSALSANYRRKYQLSMQHFLQIKRNQLHRNVYKFCLKIFLIHTFRRPTSRSRLVIHWSVFNHFVIMLLSSGLQNRSHRRGVMPLVLFWSLFGHKET